MLYLAFALLVPIAELISLIVLWTVPMTLRLQKKVFFLNEVLGAWSACEVYIIATVVALLEIGQISGFMVGNACDPLKPIFSLMISLGLLDASDGKCFYVDAELKYGAFVLIAAALASVWSNQIIVRLAESAIEDREQRSKGGEQEEELVVGCGRSLLSYVQRKMSAVRCCIVRIDPEETHMSNEAMTFLARRRSSITTPLLDFGGQTPQLPPGWVVVKEGGKIFYWSEITGETSRVAPLWTRPYASSVTSSPRNMNPSPTTSAGRMSPSHRRVMSSLPELAEENEVDERDSASKHRDSSSPNGAQHMAV